MATQSSQSSQSQASGLLALTQSQSQSSEGGDEIPLTQSTTAFNPRTTPVPSAESMNISQEECDQLVGDFVRLMLFRSSEKKPVTKEMMKEVFGEYSGKKAVVSGVTKRTQKYFLDVFGYDMHALRDGQSGAAGFKGYVLLNAMDANRTFIDTKLDWEGEEEESGLLFIVLAIIVLQSGECRSDQLEARLSSLGVVYGGDDETFGDVKALVKKFQSQRYINYSNKTQVYSIGARTVEEIGIKAIFEYVSWVFGRHTPKEEMASLMKDLGYEEASGLDDNPGIGSFMDCARLETGDEAPVEAGEAEEATEVEQMEVEEPERRSRRRR